RGEGARPALCPPPAPAVPECRLDLDPALGPLGAEPVAVARVAGRPLAGHTPRELHRPLNRLLDLVEESGIGLGELPRGDRDRLAHGAPARRLDHVDSDVHQRAAPRERLLDAPGPLDEGPAVLPGHPVQEPEVLLAGEAVELDVVRVELE